MPLLQMRPEELRVNLRRVFDDFDNDGSGTISTAEFQTILAAANVSISEEEATRLVEAADTDGSGEISFDEFLACLEKELANGDRDGMLAIVTKTESFFKWANPLSWFSRKEEVSTHDSLSSAPAMQHGSSVSTAPATEAQRTVDAALPQSSWPEALPSSASAAVPQVESAGSDGSAMAENGKQAQGVDDSTGNGSRQRNSTVSRAGTSCSIRSQKSVLSEWIMKEQNWQIAEEQREADRRLREIRQSQQEAFLRRQQQRIRSFQQQQVHRREAEEADKASKRESGKEMRVELQATFQQVKTNNQQRAALVSEKTLEVRRIKKVRAHTLARSVERTLHRACKAVTRTQILGISALWPAA